MDLATLLPGQVLVFRPDFRSRASLVVSTLLGSAWPHVALALGDGTVLNTYPGTDAEIVPVTTLTASGRDFVVLDHPTGGPASAPWRQAVVRAARDLVGSEYWSSPCSRVTAVAFVRAGVPVRTGRPTWKDAVQAYLPEDFLTRLAFVPVAASFTSTQTPLPLSHG